ncbi:MAG: MFS transporter, partial [Actinomycetes bacterium]
MQRARQRFVAVFSVLARRDMRRVWGSQVLSEVGDWAARFALAVLVYDRSGSAFLTASVLAVTYLPYLLSPVITPIAQRYSLRRMMIASDVMRMLLFALIALPMPTWALLVLAFVAGLATPPFEAARTAI